jgi:hypothetical protein
MKATPTVIRQPEAAGLRQERSLLLHRPGGGKPGGTAGVTAHALAVRARPWIPRPPAPARTDT